jgi:hypothetical protein
MKSMYTAVATATGGRNGQIKSDNAGIGIGGERSKSDGWC